MAYDDDWPTTDRDLTYDMFRRDLDVADRHARAMLRHLEAAAAEVHWDARHQKTLLALDESWRAESALGAFLAMDDIKAEQAGYRDAKAHVRRAFDALRSPLRDAERRAQRNDADLQSYVSELQAVTESVVESVAQAAGAIREPAYDALPRSDERATVAIARRTDDADDDETVHTLVREAVDLLGGMSRFVKPGQTVLIKPNLTLFFLAREGVTTDPRVVAALIRLAREAGATRVQVGESSGGGSKTRENMDVTGVLEAAEAEGAEVVPFDEVAQREIEIPNGRFIKRIALPEPLLDADVLINAPKLKCHHMDPITGAIKNWVGVVRADVREHHHDWNTYQEYAEIMSVTKPALNVMDGIWAGEGNGPGALQGVLWGGIIASADPVAMDVTAAQVLGFDPRHVTFATVAAQHGLGQMDPSRIDVVGTPLDEAKTTIKAPRIGMDYLQANVIVGLDVSHSGTMGHFKSAADIYHIKHVWALVNRLKGRPTILIGDAEDPLFEKHLEEGPYIVIDDAAPARYREDPRVTFVPGHPALHNMLPQVLEGLGIPNLGKTGMSLMKVIREARSRLG